MRFVLLGLVLTLTCQREPTFRSASFEELSRCDAFCYAAGRQRAGVTTTDHCYCEAPR